jgi:hypothetical protein
MRRSVIPQLRITDLGLVDVDKFAPDLGDARQRRPARASRCRARGESGRGHERLPTR